MDTTRHLTGMELVTPPAGAPGAARARIGVLLETLMAFLADHGLGVSNTPAPGEPTLGGTLAVYAHGTSVPAAPHPGRTPSTATWKASCCAPSTALTRSPGWSGPRGGGDTDTAAWAGQEVIGTTVPASYGRGQWAEAVGVLDRLDPHGVFGNDCTDRLVRV